MGAKTSAEGGETKPVVKNQSQPNNQHNVHNNTNCRDNYIQKKRFLGADLNLLVQVLRAKCNRSKQVTRGTMRLVQTFLPKMLIFAVTLK